MQPNCQSYNIIQDWEMGQRGSTSLIAKEIESRFLSLEWYVPKFHLLHKLWFVYRFCLWNFQLMQEDLFLTGVTAKLWVSSVSEVYAVPGKLPFSFFPLHGGLQHYKTIRIHWFPFCAKALYKITFSRHSLYSFILLYTHKRDIYYIYL